MFWKKLIVVAPLTAIACIEAAGDVPAIDPSELDAGAAASAVDADPQVALEGRSEALFAGTDISVHSCSEEERVVVKQAMVLGRTIAQSSAMAECIAHEMQHYAPCGVDPEADSSLRTQIALVQKMVKSPNRLSVRCYTGAPDDGAAGKVEPEDQHQPDYAGHENVYIDTRRIGAKWFVGNDFESRMSRLGQVADTLWHEAMHVHGYMHSPDNNFDLGLHWWSNDCPADPLKMYDSVPYIVGICMGKVAEASHDQCDMTESCGPSGYLAIVNGYPNATGCTCIRDVEYKFETNNVAEFPPTPRLGENAADEYYGGTMAAGDFDGDGFDDLAIGAPGENGGEGRVYLYYGSALGLYAKTSLPEQRTGLRGYKIGSALAAGDFNGDGKAELFIGAPGANNGAGAVYMYRGTSKGLERDLVLVQGWLPNAEGADNAAGDRFGSSLAVGKFFDRRLTLAVGVPGEVLNGIATGMVVLFGSSNDEDIVKTWGVVAQPASKRKANDMFGSTLAFGKLNMANDALVVSALGREEIHVIDPVPFGTGGAKSATIAYTIPSPVSGQTFFGASLAVGANVSDGSQTILVGAPLYSGADLTYGGTVFAFKDRRPNGGTSCDFTLQCFIPAYLLLGLPPYHSLFQWDGASPSELFGYTLAKLGNEVLVGALGLDGGRVFRMDRLLVNGVHTTSILERHSQSGLGSNEPADAFGASLVVGDFNGSGMQDFAVGAPGESPGSDPKSGSAFAFQWDDKAPAPGRYLPLSSFDQED